MAFFSKKPKKEEHHALEVSDMHDIVPPLGIDIAVTSLNHIAVVMNEAKEAGVSECCQSVDAHKVDAAIAVAFTSVLLAHQKVSGMKDADKAKFKRTMKRFMNDVSKLLEGTDVDDGDALLAVEDLLARVKGGK